MRGAPVHLDHRVGPSFTAVAVNVAVRILHAMLVDRTRSSLIVGYILAVKGPLSKPPPELSHICRNVR